MQSRVQQVLNCFTKGYNCCQSILATYGDVYGLDNETALKLAAGMGGGIGHTGKVCGFVSAACLLLGLKHGTDTAEAKLKVFPICGKFCDEFAAEYGSTDCMDIIKCDIRTMEATVKAKADGIFNICGECGQFAAELLENTYGILDP